MTGETFGKASQISGNGLFLVVGAPNYKPKGSLSITGKVSIYTQNDGEWSESSEIIGYGGSFGSALAISEDGNIIAVGANAFDSAKGKVWVYAFNEISNTWDLRGSEFVGGTGDLLGTSIALSSSGNIIAIGAPGGSEEGKVVVYKYDGISNWVQFGQDITNIDDSMDDRFGSSLDLSSDGKTVVFGGPGYNSEVGRTNIFTYDIERLVWVKLGNEILGNSAREKNGEVVTIAGDGKTIAVSSSLYYGPAKGVVRVYRLNVNIWEQIGEALTGEKDNDTFGSSLSLSDNGQIMIIGAHAFDKIVGKGSIPNQGKVYLYLVTNSSIEEKLIIDGSGPSTFFGRSVSMSSDGKTYAIGADGFNSNKGQLRIYEYNFLPTALSLSSNTLSENNSVGAVVGALSTEDPNSSDTFTYTLVAGAGDTDNSAFSISGANVLAGASFDFETKNSYSILVQTADLDGNTLTKTFTISVTDLDEDSDGDGIINSLDNCPSVANASQADADEDGVGDACDNAPNVANSDQRDTDGDGLGDVIDTDKDGDGFLDTQDAFPLDASEWVDTDGDLIGNNADPDDDNDGVLDTADNCSLTTNADQADIDADGIGDVCDPDNDNDGFSDATELACGTDPLKAADFPLDTDKDGLIDCIDPDDDNDGQTDEDELACGSDPLLASSSALDTDLDNIPNCVDLDDDNDGVVDTSDAFPLNATESVDTDLDGTGNNADPDDDNDGQTDEDELACGSDPLLASSMALDTDEDKKPNCVDPDDDNDGLLDSEDVFPLDPTEWLDSDADGIGNNADEDDDNDGYSDADELSCDADSQDASSRPSDIDGDFLPDCLDEDIDGDGYLNESDAFPLDPKEWLDTDGDGLGDNFEVDDDNDGCLDESDAFPKDPLECSDLDGDGIGDNADEDDNNDGFRDDSLFISEVLTPNSATIENTWKIINIEKYISHQIKVYNKQGQEVFSSSNYKNDWRGTFGNSSQLLPAGPYYYRINLNNNELRSGWVYLTY